MSLTLIPGQCPCPEFPGEAPVNGHNILFGAGQRNSIPGYARYAKGGRALDFLPDKMNCTAPKGSVEESHHPLVNTLETIWKEVLCPVSGQIKTDNPLAKLAPEQAIQRLLEAGFQPLNGHKRNYVYRPKHLAIYIHDAVPKDVVHDNVAGPHVDLWQYTDDFERHINRGIRHEEFWAFRNLPNRTRLPLAGGRYVHDSLSRKLISYFA